MNLLRKIFDRCADALIAHAMRRAPDFVIGGHDDPYLLRWWLIPRNRVFNVYLHKFLRDDDDRALHDHPWPWCSILLRGEYMEHTIAAGGIHRSTVRHARSVRLAGPRRAHRIELFPWWLGAPDVETPSLNGPRGMAARAPCFTLFITGPRVREWGFHCPERGWVPWFDFTAANDPGAIGRGCEDDRVARINGVDIPLGGKDA